MTDAVHERIIVAAAPDAVMAVIADFESYPEWQDEVVDVEVLEEDEDGWATKVRFEVDARITRARYVLAYRYADCELDWTLVDSDALRRNDGSYVLSDLGDGTTEVAYRLEVEPAISVPAMLRRQFARRIVDTALRSLKHRVEARAS